jgi:DNA mismatch repair protein MutS
MSNAGGIVGEFFALKREADADVLAMQVGDFYEFFGDDAELVSEELDLKVSKKGSAGTEYPMAGVPVDDLTPYLKALVERGYRVAVADQYETDDGHAREVTRVATPGTLLETTDADAQYLAAVVRTAEDRYGLAFADVTTGRFLVSAVSGPDADDDAFTELYRFSPVEVLPGPEVRNDEAFLERLRERTDAAVSVHDPNAFAPGKSTHAVREQFGQETVESLGLDTDHRSAVRAAGAILGYVEETGVGVLASMTRLSTYRSSDHVELDATTQRNLELTETMHGDHDGSLFATVDHTVSSPGARLLKEWLGRPRQSLAVLERRQECVEAFVEAALAREEVRDVLSAAYDLERLASRAASGSANAQDLLAVRDTLGLLPELVEIVEADPRLSDSPLVDVLSEPDRSATGALTTYLASALAEDPPTTTTQGDMLRQGYDDELDEIIERHEELKEYFDSLGEREKRRFGITHLQVDRNRTDGYYLQVGNSETGEVPEEYREIKSLKNSKRYTTEELDEKEREILRLEEERADLEYEIFVALRDRVASRAELLQDVGRAFAQVDALASLATHAVENGWTRPKLVEGGDLVVDQGRHPVVEQSVEFVPNDARFDTDRQFVVVTGPNMSGKSTYMRQTALIVLLAQVGSFVPANHARVGLVDGIFTRVGALDELAQGRSTFMVEMQELSNILHSATEDSLVILDEVGRGTATYDGISIAWAATEYLHNEVRAKTLFATHYHELTTLAEHLDRVANVHVAADERDGDVTFLRTVQEGPTDRSYGIHVADLAGVPGPVVDRSRTVLAKLRDEQAIEAKGSSGPSGTHQVVFDVDTGEMRAEPVAGDGSGGSAADAADTAAGADAGGNESEAESERLDSEQEEVLEELRGTNVNEEPPIELMAKVQKWQERLDE